MNKSSNFGKLILSLLFFILLLSVRVPYLYAEDELIFSGITESIRDITLSLPIEGRIDEIKFKEGDTVKKDEIILSLYNQLESLEVKRRKILWKSKAEVKSAGSRVATLKSILDSTRKLFEETRSVSKEELEKRELEYILAVAEHERYKTMELKEEKEYELAKENLDLKFLRSPITGTIIKIFFDEGESAERNRPLVQVVDTCKCIFKCNVEERIGRRFEKDDEVDLRIQTGAVFTDKKGKVIFASPIVDPASGLLEIKVEFDNEDGEVRPGVSGVLVIK